MLDFIKYVLDYFDLNKRADNVKNTNAAKLQIQTYESPVIRSNWNHEAVTQVLVAAEPQEYDNACFTHTTVCPYIRYLECMPTVPYCTRYDKRIPIDNVPRKLIECTVSPGRFEPRRTFKYEEL